jgi:hypothetical protein
VTCCTPLGTCTPPHNTQGVPTAPPERFITTVMLPGLAWLTGSGRPHPAAQWAERGGLDFEGRARWDAWSALRGVDADKARLRFVRCGGMGSRAVWGACVRLRVLVVRMRGAERRRAGRCS